jgi:TetR/AcrR family fatty acid metabolism transcriptional regulator
MAVDDRKERVLLAATRVIAEKGYEHAKISEIADQAGVASGLIYSRNFFLNKLDLLLSIVLRFWILLNQKITESVKDKQHSKDKLITIIKTIDEMLISTKDGIFLAKVLHDSLPHIYFIKEEELKEKRKQIKEENRKLLNFIDEVIDEGQKTGKFDDSLNAPLLRQVLYGSFEFLLYGVFLKVSEREENIGYNKGDIRKVMIKLVEKFLSKK